MLKGSEQKTSIWLGLDYSWIEELSWKWNIISLDGTYKKFMQDFKFREIYHIDHMQEISALLCIKSSIYITRNIVCLRS